MNIHFNDSATANASAEMLFEVITDYQSYPGFNEALIHVNVVSRDERGAEFVADRKTKIGKQVRAHDRYERDSNGDYVVERTYPDNASARSTWTIHAIDATHCTLTIDAAQDMGAVRGVAMKPLLRHMFYSINFDPFVDEAERRQQIKAGIASEPQPVALVG